MTRPDKADEGAVDDATPGRIQRREEQVVADVVRDRAGTVRLRRNVVEEPRELDVTLRHDEVDVERRPADRPLADGERPVTEQGDTTVVLVVEERLEVRTVPWVVEEIRVHRRVASEQRHVTGTVRKERFEIGAEGDVEINEQT
jgi:uncharacterized protein (TIGR02271 family)